MILVDPRHMVIGDIYVMYRYDRMRRYKHIMIFKFKKYLSFINRIDFLPLENKCYKIHQSQYKVWVYKDIVRSLNLDVEYDILFYRLTDEEIGMQIVVEEL